MIGEGTKNEGGGLEPGAMEKDQIGQLQDLVKKAGGRGAQPSVGSRKRGGKEAGSWHKPPGPASAIQLLLDRDAQGADAQRLGGPVPSRAP